MQDSYHQPYHVSVSECGEQVFLSRHGKLNPHLARIVSVVFAASQKEIHRPTTVESGAERCRRVPVAPLAVFVE